MAITDEAPETPRGNPLRASLTPELREAFDQIDATIGQLAETTAGLARVIVELDAANEARTRRIEEKIDLLVEAVTEDSAIARSRLRVVEAHRPNGKDHG